MMKLLVPFPLCAFISISLLICLSAFTACAQDDDDYNTPADTTTNDVTIDASGITKNIHKNNQHIYESSERFFNQKNYTEQPFAKEKFDASVLPASVIDSIKKLDEFWYANAVEKYKGKQRALMRKLDSLQNSGSSGKNHNVEESPTLDDTSYSGGSPFGQYLLLGIAIIVFLGAVIYFLSSNKVGFFAPRNKLQQDDTLETDIGDNIFILPYQDLLNKALKENNYRLATRILYLQTLKLLSENDIIQFKPDATNIHYLIQLSNTAYYNDFFKVTRHYEYVWYGKFDVSKNMYDIISNDFSMMRKKIGSTYE